MHVFLLLWIQIAVELLICIEDNIASLDHKEVEYGQSKDDNIDINSYNYHGDELKLLIKHTTNEFNTTHHDRVLAHFKRITSPTDLVSELNKMVVETLKDAIGKRTKVHFNTC